MPDKKDITTRSNIELLVKQFYKKVIEDESIGHFFTETVQLDWHKHMPVMYDFWETTLLGNIKYKGNPMVKHLELDKQYTINEQHFERWLELWRSTIEENFDGLKAKEAITRAEQIASLMQYKISLQRN